jgi:sugar lactone lactonase YvrE
MAHQRCLSALTNFLLFAPCALVLLLGAISAPAHAQNVTFAGAQTTVGSGLSNPLGVAADKAGDVFIADYVNNRVVEVPANGGAQTTVPASGLGYPRGAAVDKAGDVFIADTYNNRVVEVTPGGVQTTVGSGLNTPYGVAVDEAGDVFIADTYNNRVVEVPYLGNGTYGAETMVFGQRVDFSSLCGSGWSG